MAVIPASECPWCGHPCDRASTMENKRARPKPGNFCVCINCSMVNKFDNKMRLVRTSSDTEWSTLPEPTPTDIRRLRRAILLLNSAEGEEFRKKWKKEPKEETKKETK